MVWASGSDNGELVDNSWWIRSSTGGSALGLEKSRGFKIVRLVRNAARRVELAISRRLLRSLTMSLSLDRLKGTSSPT